MRFKNISNVGEVRIPILGHLTVASGDIADIPADLAPGFAAQPTNWEATDKEAKDLVKSLDEPTTTPEPIEEAAS